MRPAEPIQSLHRRLHDIGVAGVVIALLMSSGSASGQMVIPRVVRPMPAPAPLVIDDEPAEEDLEPELPEGLNSGRTVEALVEALDSSTLEDRQLAYIELEDRRDITLKQLETALDRKDLSPEQRIRLDAAALKRFSEGPRAAMGIVWNIEFPEVASIVSSDDRFDAGSKLEPGDIFVAIDGVVVNNIDPHSFVRRQIVSREPGETLHLTVLRGKQILEIDLKLGSFALLRGGGVTPTREDVIAAYRIRGERRGRISEGSSLGLTKEDWTTACTASKKRFATQMQQLRTAGGGPLVAGGAPRSGPDDDREQYRREPGARRPAPQSRFSDTGMPRTVIHLEDPLERQVASRPMSMNEVIRQTEQTVDRLRKLAATPADESRKPGLGIVPGQNLRSLEANAEVRLAAAERVLEALKAKAAVEAGEVVEKHESGTDTDSGRK